MPLDGVVIHALVHEFKDKLLNGKIDKIYQPQKDELVLNIRNHGKNHRLLLSVTSNSPRIHLTKTSSANPPTPPMFCMLLRKHITGGRIVSIMQPDFERILILHIEAFNELGDLTVKQLIIEVMGRHSNIILLNEKNIIIDSIKHIGFHISSKRQVMPGLDYIFPPSQGKLNPLTCSEEKIHATLSEQREGLKISKSIVGSFTGISPLISREICFRALRNTDYYTGELNAEQKSKISHESYKLFQSIHNEHFSPVLLHDTVSKNVIDFSAINILQYSQIEIEEKASINETLDFFYANRDLQDRLKQRGADLLKMINTNLDRCKKKLAKQQAKLDEVENKEILKNYGDLITANIYRISEGMKSIEVENFYGETSPFPQILIPLDPTLSPSKNAQKYFNKYMKAKNAEIMMREQIKLNHEEITYLESIHEAITKSESYQELDDIRHELYEQGYIKRNPRAKMKQKKGSLSKPKHFTSSDGFDIYVGKNNIQNDYLTLKFARKNDLWFHTKNIPGSHVIVKVENKDVPDSTLLEAAMLSAYYSKGRASSQVAVDYTTVKNVKKPSGAKPGMVIYEHYQTIYITPEEDVINQLENNNKS